MELPAAVTKPRWTARDSVCAGLAAFVVLNVLMCLWVAATSMSTAHRQATAVFSAVESASAIAFNLSLQTDRSPAERLNVTGRLRPHLSECSRRLHFDGRMVVTTASSASEEFVLTNHRGYRRPLSASSANATCLTTRDIPPLHTLADIVHSAFRPQIYSDFDVQCKPLQFTFYDAPFVVCAEDWLRARLKVPSPSNLGTTEQHPDPVLLVRGKQSALELTVLAGAADTPADADQPFDQLDRCEYLEAPMTSGESCSTRCPGPHIDACTKRADP
ncbi:hypothetical protein PHYPSEUDO_012315 [Phytophthora pseudosyringae]|uniref:Transmembrane protein n=1 Tax=Phytophthora pseudosyringae TaxID=221518 RepID=A0A8T1W9Y9_9STRA|nr:hypothetical protein PHYPSEUDO_012315 [Phytophthora pseudosyringae]